MKDRSRGPVAFALVVLVSGAFAACASSASKKPVATPDAPKPDYAAVVASPDRSDDDRALDEGRKPAALLAFMDVRPGWSVAELGAGGGYTTELLARVVGPAGKVFAQNPAMVVEKFVKDAWPARLARPINKNVIRVDREFDSPLPPEAKDLNLVVMNLFYHDTYWFGTDRKAMNDAVWKALRRGGAYVIIDHSGRKGTGAKEVKSLHRIEESVVVDDVEASGFALASTGDFLRNPQDTRDWMVFKERGTTDRFVLKFVKP